MKKSGVLGNLLLVFGLGVLLGVLFAPRRGEETRKMIAEKMEDTCGLTCANMVDRAAVLKSRACEYIDDLKERMEEVD